MQANAQAAQGEADSRTNHTFGSARWQGQFERVWDELKDLPGAKPVKPYGFPFELMVVGNGLLYPFLYSKTTADVRTARIPRESRLVKELFTFAPEPAEVQGVLDFADFDEEPTLTLSSRGNVDQERNVPPLTEAEPAEEQTSEDDANN
jgi:hypothetical protein